MTKPREAQTQRTPANQVGEELAGYARGLGAELYGVASAGDYAKEFPDKPPPTRFVEGAQSVIIIGMPFEPVGQVEVAVPGLFDCENRVLRQASIDLPGLVDVLGH